MWASSKRKRLKQGIKQGIKLLLFESPYPTSFPENIANRNAGSGDWRWTDGYPVETDYKTLIRKGSATNNQNLEKLCLVFSHAVWMERNCAKKHQFICEMGLGHSMPFTTTTAYKPLLGTYHTSISWRVLQIINTD